MSDKRETPPFTYRLCYILIALGFIYVIANFTFISHCAPQFYSATEGSFCQVATTFESFGEQIPAIARPVKALRRQKRDSRANVIEYAYAFSWGSALFVGLLMLISTLIMNWKVDDNQRQLLIQRDQDARRKFVKPRLFTSLLYSCQR